MERAKLDRTRSFGSVIGGTYIARYDQDGKPFNGHGDEILPGELGYPGTEKGEREPLLSEVALDNMTLPQLRARYEEVFGKPAPRTVKRNDWYKARIIEETGKDTPDAPPEEEAPEIF